MSDVYLVGTFSTAFGKRPDQTVKDLAREAYLGVLRAEDNLEASKAQERAFERQLEQTRQRFEVGLIAITDVYEAEAARDLAQVTRIVDENNVAVAKENLFLKLESSIKIYPQQNTLNRFLEEARYISIS